MSDPFIGQIKPVAYTFAPVDWSVCDGQQLQISGHQALYSLLGSQFGGNDRTFFNLPDFRGRAPLSFGTSQYFSSLYQMGQASGSATNTLTEATMPSHTHDVYASDSTGNTPIPAESTSQQANQFAVVAGGDTEFYTASGNLVSLADDTVTNTGSGASYSIIQPTTVLLFIIAMDGTYPSRN